MSQRKCVLSWYYLMSNLSHSVLRQDIASSLHHKRTKSYAIQTLFLKQLTTNVYAIIPIKVQLVNCVLLVIIQPQTHKTSTLFVSQIYPSALKTSVITMVDALKQAIPLRAAYQTSNANVTKSSQVCIVKNAKILNSHTQIVLQ